MNYEEMFMYNDSDTTSTAFGVENDIAPNDMYVLPHFNTWKYHWCWWDKETDITERRINAVVKHHDLILNPLASRKFNLEREISSLRVVIDELQEQHAELKRFSIIEKIKKYLMNKD